MYSCAAYLHEGCFVRPVGQPSFDFICSSYEILTSSGSPHLMYSASKYYALYLLTAFWGHSLATYHNASLSGHVGALDASPSSNSAFDTSSASSDTEEGCQVQLYVVNAYNWNPNVDFRAVNNSQKTIAPKNVPTNSAGTQTTTVEWTSGAILQHGTWSLLTGTTTM